MSRGVLDTSAVIALPGLPSTAGLPDVPLITAVTLAELSVGPLVASAAKERAARQAVLQQAEADFEGRTWCHGDRYSLADIALGCCLGWVDFRKPGEVDWHGSYPTLARHYHKLLERAAFADTIPR